MRSTQDKFMDALESIAKAFDMELIVDKAYGNTGKARIEGETGAPVLTFDFQFNTGYYTLESIRPNLPLELARINEARGTQQLGVWSPPNSEKYLTTDEVLAAIKRVVSRP